MPDIIKVIADKVMASKRIDKCSFDEAFNGVMQNYKNLNWAATKSAVGSELGKRRKKRKAKAQPPAQQKELDLGITRAQALKARYERDARDHENSLTAGLPEHDL
ncbi:MAG: hypothetical protein WC791_04390 [Candidatus Paceibacterota bacterium]|jgi:hypothetical protein